MFYNIVHTEIVDTLVINLFIEAKIDGNKLLSLDKGSLDQFGLSDGFQLSLMKIIKDLVCYLYECNASS